MNLFQAIFSVPALPFSRHRGWLVNRRDPQSRWVSVYDVAMNISDSWYGFSQRIPNNALRYRDRNGEHAGHYYRVDDNSDDRNPFG